VTHPYVRAANIKWGGLDLTTVKRMGFPNPQRYLLRFGDVLLNEASGSPTEVGKPAIWRDEIPGCCYQKTLLRARPRSSEVLSEWLHAAFLADALLGRFARMAPGVGILHLTADRMFAWPVPFAPLIEQREIVRRLDAAFAAIEQLTTKATSTFTRLDEAEKAVLSKGFRGELVPQDPADEPASALLERIRAASAAQQSTPRRGRAAPTGEATLTAAIRTNGHITTPRDAPLDLVIAAFHQGEPRLGATEIAEATGLDAAAVKRALAALVDTGQVRVHGRARGTTYEWSP
jgi:type I restriction enzyme S subunit